MADRSAWQLHGALDVNANRLRTGHNRWQT
jgi:hypothetical protein